MQNSDKKKVNPPLKIAQSTPKLIKRKTLSEEGVEFLASEVSEQRDIEEVKTQTPMLISKQKSLTLDPDSLESSAFKF